MEVEEIKFMSHKLFVVFSLLFLMGSTSMGNAENKALNNKIDILLKASKDKYVYLIKNILVKIEKNSFEGVDPILGKMNNIVNKNPKSSQVNAVYFAIPDHEELQLNLIKDKADQEWKYVSLMEQVVFFIESTPDFSPETFSRDLSLKKIDQSYDERLEVYRYKYRYKNNIEAVFLVKKDVYRQESYPRNFQAIEFELKD